MRDRSIILCAVVLALSGSGLVVAADGRPSSKSDTGPRSAIPRTPDGKPDFQGSWTNATYTPVERPDEFKGREYFTAEEAAAYAKRQNERFLSQPDDDAHYDNSIWMTEKLPKGMTTLRTSIVVDPADGKIPPMNEEGRKRNADKAAARRLVGPYDSAQTRGLSERCIYWAHEGPPLMPTGYNSNLQIVQAPGQFVVIPEMMPVARVIALDARPHVGSAIRNLRGDSRGWWDGDTMVVETTNFTDRTAFRQSSEHLKVTERFTMIDADTIRYQFTVEDPHTWDRPWSGEYPMKRTSDAMYEYACHEGNYGMPNILRAQRLEEEKAKSGGTADAAKK